MMIILLINYFSKKYIFFIIFIMMNQYMPNRALRYGVAGTGAVSALARAYQSMGPYAPTAKDLTQAARIVSKKVRRRRRNTRRGGRAAGKKVVRQVKGIKKTISELKKVAESDQGTHIHRYRACADIEQTASLSKFAANGNSLQFNTITRLEEVLSELRYYNPSAPLTLIQASGTTGTYHKDFYFKQAYHRFDVVNNYQVPVKVSAYCFLVKESTSIAPETAFTNGLTDVGNPSSTSCLVYPTDSPQLTELYRTASSKSTTLLPGQSISLIQSSKPFQYDPSLSDSHTSEYQKVNHAGSFGVRVEGVFGHDTIADEQGTLPCGVDVRITSTYQVIYAAGADIKFITIDDNSQTFTNAGVVSSMPVADNQSFSVN